MFHKINFQFIAAAVCSLVFSLTVAAVPENFAAKAAASRIALKKSEAQTFTPKVKTVENIDVPTEPLSEEILTQSLLAKLKNDYKTTNVVIALDEISVPKINGDKEIFKGSGDVRIGFDWQKINFTVTVSSAAKTAKVVDYSVK